MPDFTLDELKAMAKITLALQRCSTRGVEIVLETTRSEQIDGHRLLRCCTHPTCPFNVASDTLAPFAVDRRLAILDHLLSGERLVISVPPAQSQEVM